jgi:diguanylate cyclase (GGDEF)-like protein
MDPRPRLHVVVIDRSSPGVDDLLGTLRQGGFAVSGAIVDSPASFAETLRERPWDLVLATQRVPGFGIPRALTVLRAANRDLPLVGLAPVRRDGDGVALLALGARDVVDPANRDLLLAVVRREVASLSDRRRLRQLERLRGLRGDPTTQPGPASPAEFQEIPPRDDAGTPAEPYPRKETLPDADRDYLTRLPNRGFFVQALAGFIDQPSESRTEGHLILVELENFRALRQNAGITTCDAIVGELAEVVGREVGASDLLARFGDSSFAVLTLAGDVASADRVAERVRRAVKATVVEVGGQFFATTCSIGIATVAPGVTDLRVALSRADQACRRAILAGGNQARRFEAAATDGRVHLLRTLAPDLVWGALGEERLSLLFQPVIPLHGEPRAFYQAYLRMLDLQGGAFPVDPLECAAHDPALALKLDIWVVSRALETAVVQRAAGLEPMMLVRLSDTAIQSEVVPLHLSRLLHQHHLEGEQFVFEVSESAARRQVRFAQSFVNALRRLGCSAAIADETGPRPSGLSLVHHVDARYVKLSGAFVRGLAEHESRQAALRAFQENARRLGRVTIASGVEDPTGLAVLWHCKVDYAEGDYIQEPQAELAYDFDGTLA